MRMRRKKQIWLGNIYVKTLLERVYLHAHKISRGSTPKMSKQDTLLKLIDHALAARSIWRLDGEVHKGSQKSAEVTYLYLVNEGDPIGSNRPLFSIRRPHGSDWIAGKYRKIGFEEAKALIDNNWERRYFGY